MLTKPSDRKKIELVIHKNTFFCKNDEYEESNEKYINSIVQLLLSLKNKVDSGGPKKEIFVDLITTKENGLKSLFALTGFSKEFLLRLITFIRGIENAGLNSLVNKKHWPDEDIEKEWNEDKIEKLIKGNKKFAEGIINLFFEGATNPLLSLTLPLFELKKLNVSKLDFSPQALVDTLVRYRFKGSYSASGENNPEGLIKKILKDNGVSFERGRVRGVDRDMDFIIPYKSSPRVIIESSYVVTTSSGMGNKARDEIGIRRSIKKHYPKCLFIGFIDGAGWFVRRGDLKRMVSAFDDVFTFGDEELARFQKFVTSI